ncbi:unnamed protein product, partial [Linum tenue]
ITPNFLCYSLLIYVCHNLNSYPNRVEGWEGWHRCGNQPSACLHSKAHCQSFSDRCSAHCFFHSAEIILVYSVLCPGYDGAGIFPVHCLQQRSRSQRRQSLGRSDFFIRGGCKGSSKNNGEVQ